MSRADGNTTRPTLAIVLEGGLVQAIVARRADKIDLDILVIDYDIEGADDDEISLVPQGDGTFSEACVRSTSVTPAEIDLDHIIDQSIAE